MDDRRFDQFTRSLIAQPCTRRRWLRGWVGFVLGSWLARRGTAGAAEEAAGECGRVGDACAADGDCCAGARCANNGTCVCRAGRTDCGDGRCRDLQIDERNCGGCGTACRADQVCLDGACACPDGRPECRGRCCPAGSACLGLGLCCPADRACGLACCAADQVCRRAGADQRLPRGDGSGRAMHAGRGVQHGGVLRGRVPRPADGRGELRPLRATLSGGQDVRDGPVQRAERRPARDRGRVPPRPPGAVPDRTLRLRQPGGRPRALRLPGSHL